MVFRNEAEFQQEFHRTFDSEMVDVLIEALSKGYLTSQDLYDASRGSNNSTFGTGVYHHAVFELQNVAEDSENRIVTSLLANTFRMQIGKFDIACHKVGEFETDNILGSFPKNYTPKRDAAIDPNQLAIEFPKEFEPTEEEQNVSSELVLAHMGNPEQGLCAVYFCRPRYSAENEVAWEFTHQLWTKTAAIANVPKRTYDRPQDETSPKPQVQRKKKPAGDKPQDETSPKPQVRRKKKETGNG